MYMIVAGGGKVGFHLAVELLEQHNEVLVIERDATRASHIRDELGDNVMTGDSCEALTLDAAGVARAELVVAVTGDDEDNLVICDIARYRGVKRTIARINNPRNGLLFEKRGIETTISATQAVLAQIEQELPTQMIIPLLQLHSGLEIVEIKLPETSPVAGRSVREVLLPPESMISLIVGPGRRAAHARWRHPPEQRGRAGGGGPAREPADVEGAVGGLTHGLDT